MRAKIEGTLTPEQYLDQIDDIERARARTAGNAWSGVSSLRFRVYPEKMYSVGSNGPGIYEINVRNGIVFGARVATDGTFALGAEPPLLADIGAFCVWLFGLEMRHMTWEVWDPATKSWMGPEHRFMNALQAVMKAFST